MVGQAMIKRVKLIIFLTMALLTSSSLYSEESKPPEYLKYVDEIVADFAKEMKKKYKLHCYGDGGSMPTDVAEIDVLFISYSHSTVDEARKMEVNAVQELLKRINSHEKIRPYLREYPFSQDRVGVSISFRTETDSRPLDGSVAYVSIGKGKIFYYSAEMKMTAATPLTYMNEKNEVVKEMIPGTLEENLIDLMNEPYEKALKIVKAASTPNQK